MQIQALHWTSPLISTVFFTADLILRIGLSLRVIMCKKNYGVSYAWLVVVLLVPFLGGLLYLCFGENRLSERRIKRILKAKKYYYKWLQQLAEGPQVDWSALNPEFAPIQLHTQNLVGIPAMAGNNISLLHSQDNILDSIIKDIEASQSTCHLQFYIWEAGGRIKEISEALIRARKRGVICRILLDAIGSRGFFSSASARRMEQAGIKIQASLPAGIYRAIFARMDIRNHRKIIVIDGKIAYTGSQNMVDAIFFKQESGVGHWVDIVARIRGPVVETLAATFASDWYLEAEQDTFQQIDDVQELRHIGDIYPQTAQGTSAVQLVPSGPGFTQDAIHSLLLTVIYSARKELIMTTPYFIPDESLLTALKAAALRGVRVILIIPQSNDSKLVKYASRAKYDDLTYAGVEIMLFNGGLLHSKTITVDGDLALFGSVNLDMRSFWLNFEVTLVIYCRETTQDIRRAQMAYLRQSAPLDLRHFHRRHFFEKLKENCALLVSPTTITHPNNCSAQQL
ncbi:cardiolipin synthase [Desulfotalea psychrophila]|uniref:Cardiolipin synthase n=1 Tax=Desulfotalea psychrophila (strain LSv54 / DSM 12343) TaxID=177439 RepID=Q6AJK9_DESPS|nr:cardiolipin synthase [Desulfotalea psychrophila]CAG37471.1 related to cardiolipin synthetase [Desulfotalea psychrophila LSv54]